MATKKSSRHHPEAKQPSPQADAWTVYVQSKLVELEAAKAVSDRKWGENRLITLVDSGLREKFWIQNGKAQGGASRRASQQAGRRGHLTAEKFPHGTISVSH